MERSITRRSFTSMAAAATAGLALAASSRPASGAEAAGSAARDSVAQDPASYDVSETIDADVVVMGAGPCGCAAAVQAAELGAKVALLEKADAIGGKGMRAEGIFAVESEQQKEAGVDLTLEEMFQAYMLSTAWMADGAMVYNYFSQSAETIDWLAERGIPFLLHHNTQVTHEDKFTTYHKYEDTSMKAEYFDAFIAHATDAGAQVLTGTAGVALVMDGDGKAAGLIAQREDGSFIQVNASAVILSSGGWGSSEELRERFSYAGTPVRNPFDSANTGDSQRMAWQAGAKEGNWMQDLHGVNVPAEFNGAETLERVLCSVGSLWVSGAGIRFTNEEVSLDSAFAGNVAVSQRGDFYALVDSAFVDAVEKGGGISLGLVVSSYSNHEVSPVNDPWEGMRADLESSEAGGGVTVADTIEELAEKCGMLPENLAATVERYNADCEAGEDTMFGKNPAYMVPFSTPPFYAVRGRSTSLGAKGGIAVDSRLEVLGTDGRVMGGLYAAGNDVANIYNNVYPQYEGVSCGFAFNSGRLAAKAAAHGVPPVMARPLRADGCIIVTLQMLSRGCLTVLHPFGSPPPPRGRHPGRASSSPHGRALPGRKRSARAGAPLSC